jgi:HAE1 family hydrophobic/amphiphilic exporter-1
MSLPEFSIHRPVTVLMGISVAVLLGTIAFVQIPVDLMPETEYPTLTVSAVYPGVAPAEMETLVARPLEEAVASAPGVEEITSTSNEGQASVRVRFAYGENLDEAANELRSRIDRIRRRLPEDMDSPTLFKFDTSQFPVMFISVRSDEMDAKELRHFAERSLQFRIERVPGVAQARISGGLRRQIQVELNLEKLRALNLSVSDVVQRLSQENQNVPVGPVREGRYEVLLRSEGEFTNLDDILNVGIANRNGVPVHVRDIATVTDGHEEIRYVLSVNGEPAIRMFIYKQSGANTVKVSDAVKKEMAMISLDYKNVRAQATWDSATFIRASIDNVQTSTLAGGILAVGVLMFFLRSFTATLIIGIAIPISVIATFALMYFNGFTLNTVSFGGLALGVGMLVDNSIVVLENIFRHREGGKSMLDAAVLGSREVGMAITASTMTTIAVFVPVLFMGGISAQTFQQLAWVVSFALLCSLIISLTVVPTLCARMLRGSGATSASKGGLIGWFGDVQDRMAASYGRALGWSLNNRMMVVGSAVALMAGSAYIMQFIGVELQPEVDEGQIRVSVQLEPGTRVDITDDFMQRLSTDIRASIPEAKYVMTESGNNGGGFRYRGTNTGQMRIDLVPASERDITANEVAAKIRSLIQVEPGVLVRTRVQGSSFSRRGQGEDDRLSVEVRGHNPVIVDALAVQVRNAMMETPGVPMAQVMRQPGTPEMVVRVDRAKASSMGLPISTVARSLETAIGGSRASMFRQDGDEYDIIVRLREQDRLDVSQVGEIPITLPNGESVLAQTLVSTARQEGPIEIMRKDQERMVLVAGTIAGRDLGSVVTDVRAKLQDVPRPRGYDFVFGGEYEEQQEAFRSMTFAAILALALVYMVMAAQFESLRDPFIILFSIPLAFVGVSMMLFLSDTTFNMQGFLGVIILVGIVVNNAIVLIDYANRLIHEHGMRLREAVVTAGIRRLRPILMTTITTVLGLIPMSLGIGEGGELQAPMARVIIGGLTASTLITLVFIPVIYFTLEGRAERVRESNRLSGASPELQPMTSGD